MDMMTFTKILIVLFIISVFLSANIFAQNETSGPIEPKLISKPELEYPPEAYMGRVAGKVWVNILVGEDGVPVKTKITKRDPEMAYLFDNVARKWGMGCRFNPALDNMGNKIPMWILIPLVFGFNNFTPAECIKQEEPEYPTEARELGMEGWVGLAILVKSNNEVDMSQIIIVAREPQSASVFDQAAKDAAYHSSYRAAGFEHSAIEGWCFIKVTFNIIIQKADDK